MCQYCLEGHSGLDSGMSLLPLITRLRNLYKRTCCGRNPGILTPPSTETILGGAEGRTATQPSVNSQSTPFRSPDRVAREEHAPLVLQKDGVRVLLFRECDTRGRKLLYDSKTVVQVPIGDAAPHAPPAAPKTLFKGSWGAMGASTQSQGQKTAVRASGQRSEAFAEVSGGFGYLYQQKEADTKQVSELVFGSEYLAYRGSCSKLHLLQDSSQRVLLSRTAPAPASHLPKLPAASDPGIDDGSFSSSISSLSDATVPSGSLEVPWGLGGTHTLAMKVPRGLGSSLSEGDSGFCGPPSPYSSTCGSFLSPVSAPNTPHGTPSSRQGSGNSLKNSGSFNSLQRRFLRSLNTSLEALGVLEEGGRGASPSHPPRRATKLGLAVVIQLHHNQQQESVESWLFLHLGVIEGAINKLQTALHSAYLNRQNFVSTTHAAVSKLQQDLVDLVSGPRLGHPIWLGLLGQSAGAAERHALCTSFVDTLAAVLSTFDTKHTNFFVSKLLTAVLTHHLGWVSTVAPNDSPPLPPPPTTAATTTTAAAAATTAAAAAATVRQPFTPAQPSWAERLSESHPYSAVWAQLCELSGAVGYPPRAARTVLLGSNASLLHHLLTILSYVIRCSQVVEQQVEASQGVPNSASALPRHLQASSSSSAASIATIVEEVPGVQREASLRHRRAARGGGRSQETRGEGDTVEQKDVGEGKRWMLNDGEEIVIRVDGARVASPSSSASPHPSSPHAPQQLAPQSPNASQTPNAASLPHPAQTLSTSKTSFDLSSLACEDDEVERGERGDRDTYLPPAPPSSLYPPLHHLDDHRETFGPVVLEPGKIAEKVQKLFRSKRENDTAHSQTPQPHSQTPQTHPQIQPQPQQMPLGTPSQSKTPSKVPLSLTIPPNHTAGRTQPQQTPTPSSQTQPCPQTPQTHSQPPQPLGTPVKLKTPSKVPLSLTIPPPHTAAYTQPQQTPTPSSQTQQTPTASTQPPLAPVPPPRTRKSLTRSGSRGTISGGLESAGLRKVHPDCVVVPAKDILPEVEEGGRVLLLHHSSPPQPSLHTRSDTHINRRTCQETYTAVSESHIRAHTHMHTYPSLSPLHTQSDTHIHTHTHTRLPTPATHSQSDTHIHTKLTSGTQVGCGDLTPQVTCLPRPVDTRRRVRLRNVGRESECDLTNLERTVYPRLSHLKEVIPPSVTPGTVTPMPCRVTEALQTPTTARATTQTHRRHHSDPTNGLFTSFPAPSLQVLEEVEGKGPGHPHIHTDTTEVDEVADVCPAVDEKEDEKVEEVEEEQETEREREEPVLIEMPRCIHASTTSSQRHGLAGSLLGGVLDHYSSPFVLHATTQTQRWEDSLRQDLSSAAHHSPLDPQLAEAVAVVADTDSWEVQVVSSHSYVVGGGSGSGSGVIGQRVDASPLVSSIMDSVVHLTKLGVSPHFVVQHFEELLSELYLKSQLLAQYLLGGAVGGAGGGTATPYHLPDLTRSLGLDVNDLPLLLTVASTHTPAVTHMYGLCVR